MRTRFLMVSLQVVILLLASCDSGQVVGSGKIVADYREVGEFQGIAFWGTGTLLIKQGFKTALIIQGDENLLDYLESGVHDEILHIGPKEGKKPLFPTKEFIFYVTVRDLDHLKVAGSGEVKSIEQILGERLNVNLEGSVRVLLDVEMKALSVALAGGAKAFFKGEVVKQSVVISGQGSYDGCGLCSKQAVVKLTGNGRAILDAKELLDVVIIGTGSVKFKGSPKVTTHVVGEGKVSKY